MLRECERRCSPAGLTQTYAASYAEHPLRSFLESGLLATISTDDPTTSAINLAHEYEVAAAAAGLDRELICRAAANAVDLAFLSKGEKNVLLVAPA